MKGNNTMKKTAPAILAVLTLAFMANGCSQANSKKANMKCESAKEISKPKVVGFTYAKTTPFQYEKLTHIIYAFIDAGKDGNVGGVDLRDFADQAHKHNVKAIASIASSFVEATDNADGSRDSLVANVTKYLIDNNLDGIDYDWEGPALTDEQRENYSNLIKETHEAFKPHGFTVCIDTCWRKELYPWAIEYIDWINCMAYDGGWPNHSSFERGVKLLETWELGKNAPREKLLWGTGFYARNKSGNALEYKRIMDKYHPGPEVDLVDEWGYPGIDNTIKRTQYVLDKGYGGMMIWNLDHDTQDGTSLLKAIDDTIKRSRCP